MSHVVWHGTRQESLELLHAIRQHCACQTHPDGRLLHTCPAHTMLARDQRAVDGLVFMRRLAARLLAEEFDVGQRQRRPSSRASNVSSAILT